MDNLNQPTLAQVIPISPDVAVETTSQTPVVVVKPKRAKKTKQREYNIPESRFHHLFDKFLNGKARSGGSGKFRIKGDELIHVTHHDHGRTECVELVARRIRRDGEVLYIGNSSVLRTVGVQVAYGSIQYNNSETEVQRELAKIIPMIPFSVFTEAKLDLAKIKIKERGPAETVTIERLETDWELKQRVKREGGHYYRHSGRETVTEERHYTGASLFSIGGVNFLFDIDRREIEHRIFNPFLVRLPKAVATIQDAYSSLKPKAVLQAERAGLKVLRQGEWFFIPVDKKTEKQLKRLSVKIRAEQVKQKKTNEYLKVTGANEIELRAGRNRPNHCQGIIVMKNGKVFRSMEWTWENRNKVDAHNKKMLKGSKSYATGECTHSGREHAPLQLRGWFRPIPNTGTVSWQISGDID